MIKAQAAVLPQLVVFVEGHGNKSTLVNIALVAHNAGNIGLHSRKELFGELLCVIAVVRLVTVKVGVEGIADGGNGDRLRIVLQIVLCKLRVELAVNRRRNV